MREAIGGAWLYYIFVVMIMFIVSFLAVFLNYMAAYRANNHLISILEQSEGILPDGIEEQLNANFSYYNDFKACYFVNGKGFVIRVSTYMAFKIPLVEINLNIPVKNETRTINCYNGQKCPTQNAISSLQSRYGALSQCNGGW